MNLNELAAVPLLLLDEKQREVVSAICEAYTHHGVLLQIPVGGGKTRIVIAVAYVRYKRQQTARVPVPGGAEGEGALRRGSMYIHIQ
jgi:hypothetical protein